MYDDLLLGLPVMHYTEMRMYRSFFTTANVIGEIELLLIILNVLNLAFTCATDFSGSFEVELIAKMQLRFHAIGSIKSWKALIYGLSTNGCSHNQHF